MLTVRSGVAERLSALLATIRLLSAVQAFVLGQMVLVLEGFSAKVAGERSLTWKNSNRN